MDDDSTAKSILLLLEEEKYIIRAGKFEELPKTLRRKEDFLKNFLEKRPTISNRSLQNIRQKIDENSLLLEAVLAGMKEAISRIDEIRSVRAQLSTYSGDGSIQRRNGVNSSISIKA